MLRTPRRALAAALALTLTALVGAAAAAPSSPPAGAGFGVDFTATDWRFTTGDDQAWKAPAFDDSAWEVRKVPDDWGKTGQGSYDGYAWYRKTFTLPKRPAGVSDSSLILAMGFIDDADETYLNGAKVGATGGFPPAFDSQWDVPREYFPAAGVLKWGARNVLAVRMYDGTGGGGFYKGPIGLFSKQKLRELRGLKTSPADAAQVRLAQATLARQAGALQRRDVSAYAATLAPGFFHAGDTTARRLAEVRSMAQRFRSVQLTDAQTEVVVDRQGRIVVDTIRSWSGVDAAGKRTSVYAPTRQFLYLDPRTGKELGDRSRFFRDGYASPAMAKDVQFNVYLPPSYSKSSTRRFPVVYLLHGINGSNIEWEVRNTDRLLDGLFTKGGLEESIVVFPDGSSGWYVDSSAGNYRTMIVDEILPLVDAQYRTKADRAHRAMSGVSMGGFGAYSIGLEHPELFSSLASHMGALSLPGLAGSTQEMAINAQYQPMAMVAARTPDQLKQYRFYMDGGDSDIFRFGEAARVMSAQLTAKTVPHTSQYGPGGHDDAYFVPKLKDSFAMHSEQFRSAAK